MSTLDHRTLSNLRLGQLLGQAILRNARHREAAAQHRVGSIFDIVDVVLAPDHRAASAVGPLL